MIALVAGTFAVGVYGGYFTAAQGILLIAVMGALLPGDMQRMNAAKNLLSLIVNIVAALAYTVVAFDRISWAAAGLIAVGSLAGGFLGAHYGRRLSPAALRRGDRRGGADRVVAPAGGVAQNVRRCASCSSTASRSPSRSIEDTARRVRMLAASSSRWRWVNAQ